jgi:hypothetical protein
MEEEAEGNKMELKEEGKRDKTEIREKRKDIRWREGRRGRI